MSKLTEADVEKIVVKLRVGEVDSIYGPARFGGARIWEIWVYHKEQWETRFLFEQEDKEALYFDTFVSLMDHLNEFYRDAVSSSGAIDWTRTKELADLQLKKITLYVAALAFIATVGVVLYQSIAGDGAAIFASLVAGIIASGGALFFGRWIGNPLAKDKVEPAVQVVGGSRVVRRRGKLKTP